MVRTLTGRRMLRLVACMFVAACCFGAGSAKAAPVDPPCPDDGNPLRPACTKEIRIYNNTPRPLWAVVQGSIQLADALGCLKKGDDPKSGGDVWLQAAFGRKDSCFKITNDYYIFINPKTGIPKGGYVSIKLPWWSKTTGVDKYIDWWRGGRVILFDDKTAFTEAWSVHQKNPVAFAPDTQTPRCSAPNANVPDKNLCKNEDLFIAQVKPGTAIDPHMPFQLNEYTFADVSKVIDAGKAGGELITMNQGYNVSNVDQIYLPLAMEPVRDPANVGYMGTIATVPEFRQRLTRFVKTPANPVWPVYNNPVVEGGKRAYPTAGIRLPAAYSVFAYYMNPGKFPDGKTDILVPKTPPKLVDAMIEQWNDCTKASPVGCVQSAYYKDVDAVFRKNYKSYTDNCTNIPDFLKPVGQTGLPKRLAYLAYIYGWVPFDAACGGELPTIAGLPPLGGHSVVDYNEMQYNYQPLAKLPGQWFNPYTHLIHADIADGGLAASAYAFSVDDRASYLNNSGGKLTGGLIFAVGGPHGLVNGKPHAPPLKEYFNWYDFAIGLGTPAKGEAYWTKYGICSETANIPFAEETYGLGLSWGVDPAVHKINAQNPCPITLEDSKGRKYQFIVLKANAPGTTLPQKPIWPAHEVGKPDDYDHAVMSCPDKAGFVPAKDWCVYTNQVARPQKGNEPGFNTISARQPLP
jgi:hypothetical protein